MKNKTAGRTALRAAVLLAVLAGGLLAAFLASFGRISNSSSLFYDYDSFAEDLRLCLLTRYWQAECAWNGAREPSILFFDDTNAWEYANARGEIPSYAQHEESEEAGDSAEEDNSLGTRGGLKVYAPAAATAIDNFNSTFRSTTDNYTLNWGNLYCTVVNNATGEVYAPLVDLSGVLNGAAPDDGWNYLLITRYDSAGTLAYQETFRADMGSSTETSARLEAQADTNRTLSNNINSSVFSYYDYIPPRNVTVIFAIPHALVPGDAISRYASTERSRSLFLAYDHLYNIALLCACALALLFGLKKGGGQQLAHLPVEAVLLMQVCVFGLVRDPLYELCWNAADGTLAAGLAANFSLDPPAGDTVAYAAAFAGIWAALAGCFAAVLALRQAAAVYGVRKLLTQRCLCWHGLCWCARQLRRLWRRVWARCGQLWHMITRIDLREPADRTLIRLLTVNFFILAFICCFWFAGILGMLIYSAVLFILLRERLRNEQKNYETLLAGARRMAAGDLATPVTGEMGLFDPLRGELNEVRAGFEKAVEEEVRSRNMKTELITNVSHDLKTPLTAIITYIGLLKDESLTPEVRAQYVDTLDKKSQRLKRLIEDLFEISKAASGNAVMHYAEVDLASLLRQVACELADTIEQSGVDFRWQMPEHRVPLVLDGQKTCRIFENLIVNITKYALPGTRAYITLTETARGAVVECKNVSAAELDFDTTAITERFVRGDRARSTEGSGLGLAIVKSFAELQGGAFEVITDGDLFKALVTFAQGNTAEEQQPGF